MIHFNLRCDKGHEFEAWFQNGGAFEKQAKRRQVECPSCGDTKIAKAPMAPTVRAGKALGDAAELRRKLSKLRDHVEKNCENVGNQFAEEARKIHYGETEPRGIYGESTDAEAASLTDEGVRFARIPWVKRGDS